mmetsp:Transcript_6962/g.17408  ORF Transcript_6962/g.17408 Transcript_6962/m.17408 type:complete len:208 (+) Transcript_6962:343-966(+)
MCAKLHIDCHIWHLVHLRFYLNSHGQRTSVAAINFATDLSTSVPPTSWPPGCFISVASAPFACRSCSAQSDAFAGRTISCKPADMWTRSFGCNLSRSAHCSTTMGAPFIITTPPRLSPAGCCKAMSSDVIAPRLNPQKSTLLDGSPPANALASARSVAMRLRHCAKPVGSSRMSLDRSWSFPGFIETAMKLARSSVHHAVPIGVEGA